MIEQLEWTLRDPASCPDLPRRAGEPFRPFEGAAGGYLSALNVARGAIKALVVNGVPLVEVLDRLAVDPLQIAVLAALAQKHD